MADNKLIQRSRYAIGERSDGTFAIIALAITPSFNLVSSYDPRCQHPAFSLNFATPDDADKAFADAVRQTRDGGVPIRYLGPRNFG